MVPTSPPPAAARFDTVGYACAISGTMLFSSKGVFIKLAYAEGLTPDTVLALRMVVAVPFYVLIGIVLLWRDPERRLLASPRNIAWAGAVGTLGYFVASLLDFSGLAFLSAQFERLVLFTYPFFTLALGVLLFGDRMNWRLVPAMLLSYAGLLVLFGWTLANQPDGLVLGTGLVLASALAFALYQHLARQTMKVMGSRLFTCIAMGPAGLIAIGWATAGSGPGAWGSLSPAGLGLRRRAGRGRHGPAVIPVERGDLAHRPAQRFLDGQFRAGRDHRARGADPERTVHDLPHDRHRLRSCRRGLVRAQRIPQSCLRAVR